MTGDEALRFIEQHGVVLEAARGPVPSLADAALGAERRGSWWGHPQGKAFFWLTRQVRTSKNILVCRLVDGKITYVHRRVWPALVRLAPTIELHDWRQSMKCILRWVRIECSVLHSRSG